MLDKHADIVAPLCPICGGQLRAQGACCSLDEIFSLWQPICFSPSLVEDHKSQSDYTRLFVCCGCELEIFLPQIIGSPGFYVEAYNLSGDQNNSNFTYSQGKWDFDQAMIDVLGCKRLLEIGCGPGHFLARARGIVPEVYGIEYTPTAAKEAHSRGLAVFEADALPLALLGTFDAVFSFHVLEHVADPVMYIESLKRFVRPGGIIGISTPNQGGPIRFMDPCPMNMPPHHATRWTRRTFEVVADKFSLLVERVAYEPLLLENHSYYSVFWPKHAIRGSSFPARMLRGCISFSLRGVFRGMRMIGLRYLRTFTGQSIYVLFRRKDDQGSGN